MTTLANIAVLISGRGSNLSSLIKACKCNTIAGQITLVVSNVGDAPGLALASAHGINTVSISHKDYPDRDDFEQAIAAELLENNVDFVLLAGFMRILGQQFVERFRGRMVNIHPSLLPRYPGLHTHAKALAAGDTQTGASVHFVTPELDGGPVIIQGIVDIEDDDNEATLSARVLAVEHIIYPMATRWLISGRASLEQNHYHLDGGVPRQVPTWYQNKLQTPGNLT